MAYPQETFTRTVLTPGSLLHSRRNAVSTNTLLYQLDVLRKTGRYDAFKLESHPSYTDSPDVWPIPNHLFWDSDVAKWIEGACYALHDDFDAEVDRAIRELVEMINRAQQPDGYLNIHYTVVEPGKRFTNLRDMHELYNAGHLIEAALAHQEYYKNDDLLKPILKYVDLLCDKFGPDDSQTHGYPGHPEIELALLRLYHRTGEPKILHLAEYFILERGNPRSCDGEHYYLAEARAREDDPNKKPAYWPSSDCLWYYQAHKPILEQETIEGHSVRAMYLLTAVSDLVRLTTSSSSSELSQAVSRLWRNMVDRKMYVTGGIGAMKQWEGFGLDYFLPIGTDEGGCYSETCAAIGVMMLAQRLLQTHLNGEYGDIMELCLYNSVLTAMSYDGKAFTYVNQLASSETDPSKRESWFTCACCPPNIMRLLGQIGGYVTSYDTTKNSTTVVNVHLFVSSTTRVPVGDNEVKIVQSSDWPWSGDIKFQCQNAISTPIELNIRIPGWAENFTINPPCPNADHVNGYLHLPAEWVTENPSFSLSIPLKPRFLSPHPFTNQDTLSIARGPIVYCAEDVDNTWVRDHFKSVLVSPEGEIEETLVKDKTTGDENVRLTLKNATTILPVSSITGGPSHSVTALQHTVSNEQMIDGLHLVPYYFRANRGGQGHMRVSFRRWHNWES